MECVIIFFLDAFRYDYLEQGDAPFLNHLAESGISGPLRTILGFTGIGATLLSGTYPEIHGMWTQYYYDPDASPFRWIDPVVSLLDKVDWSLETTESLFLRKILRYAILQASLVKSGISYAPGGNKIPFSDISNFHLSLKRNFHEKHALGKIPTLFDILRRNKLEFDVLDYPFVRSDQQVIRRIKDVKQSSKVIYVRLSHLDTVTHRFGVGSNEQRLSVKRTDKIVSFVVQYLRKRGFDPIILVFADHGMVNVSKKVDVLHFIRKTGLREGKDFVVFLDSTMARFWGDSRAIKRISKALECLKSGKLLSRKDLAKYHAPISQRYGEVIYLVNAGLLIHPNYFQGRQDVSAMHGYDPMSRDLRTIFILSGSGISQRNLEEVKLVDILPTILGILKIAKPNHCTGVSRLI